VSVVVFTVSLLVVSVTVVLVESVTLVVSVVLVECVPLQAAKENAVKAINPNLIVFFMALNKLIK